MNDMMIKNSLVKIKEHLPYVGYIEGKVLLNSMAKLATRKTSAAGLEKKGGQK
jgi:hypothetical protein